MLFSLACQWTVIPENGERREKGRDEKRGKEGGRNEKGLQRHFIFVQVPTVEKTGMWAYLAMSIDSMKH